jgi:O-acetyl-ADP-ribose deacetylase (regulator of RNase III)
MIHEVSGDILLSRAQVLAHGVAPNDSFAHGLALALRQRWPSMYRDFRHWCHTEHPKEGTIWAWAGVGPTTQRIVALMTQEAAYGHGSTPGVAHVEHVNHALKALRTYCESEQIRSLALPRLATGVGRLAWEHVLPLIHQHLGPLKLPVLLYTTYHPGVPANESQVLGHTESR